MHLYTKILYKNKLKTSREQFPTTQGLALWPLNKVKRTSLGRSLVRHAPVLETSRTIMTELSGTSVWFERISEPFTSVQSFIDTKLMDLKIITGLELISHLYGRVWAATHATNYSVCMRNAWRIRFLTNSEQLANNKVKIICTGKVLH